MARSPEDYLGAIKRSLPQGPAFPREEDKAPNRDAILAAIAEELAREDEAIDRFRAESAARTTRLLLRDWEEDYGLPDCSSGGGNRGASHNTPQQGLTRQERLALLGEKIRRSGSLNPEAIRALCVALGYRVRITERRPFVCGLSRCGERLGQRDVRYWWSVTVLGPRVTRFRAGSSTTGEKLLALRRAEDLECLLEKVSHSDTRFTVGYQPGPGNQEERTTT